MCRLYLYTTLQINKILEVVHHPMPHESMPGKDSANKKLNALLDKEPRWLKPKNEEDMFRRCAQLDRSSIRRSPISHWAYSPFTRTHSSSAPPPFSHDNTTPIKQEQEIASATLEVPPWKHSPVGKYPSAPYGHLQVEHRRSVSDDVTNGLARVNTGWSTSTDQTTGSFHRILQGYSDDYVRSVKRLVKRYTAPMADGGKMGMSPVSDTLSLGDTWYNDADAAPKFNNNRPFPLAGDFLSTDLHLRSQYSCFANSVEHQKRWCMCHAQNEALQNGSHPGGFQTIWNTAEGLTAYANQIMATGPVFTQIENRDDFGNTILHLLAARGPEHMLIGVLSSEWCSAILNDRNSSGQTFLHVLGDFWYYNVDSLFQLLDLSIHLDHQRRFDLAARDCYGRTFFHVIMSANVPAPVMPQIWQRYGGLFPDKTDAFGFNPNPRDTSNDMEIDEDEQKLPPSPEPDADPSVIKDRFFLRTARRASTKPWIEDDEGRNGLHCLAMASLSVKSVRAKSNTDLPALQKGRKRGKSAEELLDSSEDRLQFRKSLAEGLLKAGVDPNHYDSYGNTPLMAFCAELPEDDDYKTGPSIIKLLLDHGADINARNRCGETALHIAVRCGRKLAVKTLIERDANVHARDAAGRSALSVIDAKMRTCRDDVPVEYCHLEACRAHLSGKGMAVQEPTVLQEWGVPQL